MTDDAPCATTGLLESLAETRGPMSDPIVESVRADLLARSERGIAKYGVTLAREDLSPRDWAQHLYEELLDASLYVRRLMPALPPHPTPADKRAAFDGLVAAMLMAFRALEVSELERALIAATVAKEMGR